LKLILQLLNGQPPKPEILEEVDDDYVASLIDSLCTFGKATTVVVKLLYTL